jgi:hypothetical protein
VKTEEGAAKFELLPEATQAKFEIYICKWRVQNEAKKDLLLFDYLGEWK